MDPEEHCEKWGAISLSLVLNFVPDAKDRGEGGPSYCKPHIESEVMSLPRSNVEVGTYHAPPWRSTFCSCMSPLHLRI